MDFKELNLYTERYATSESGGRARARRQSDSSSQTKTVPSPSDQAQTQPNWIQLESVVLEALYVEDEETNWTFWCFYLPNWLFVWTDFQSGIGWRFVLKVWVAL